MAVAVRWLAVPVIWAETSLPTLMPPMPCTVPVIVVALVTAAVTEGPLPPMVIDVPLTASTLPVRSICSCPFPFPDIPGNAGRPVLLPAGADALGVAPSAVLGTGVPLTRNSPAATPADPAGPGRVTGVQLPAA